MPDTIGVPLPPVSYLVIHSCYSYSAILSELLRVYMYFHLSCSFYTRNSQDQVHS